MRRKIVVQNNELFDDLATMISSGESVVLRTKGQSMRPFIIGGEDSVELTKIDDEIEIGDILLAKIDNPSRYVIHRVVKIEDERVTLMGDGNLVGIEECSKESVVARVTSIIKPNRIIDPNSKYQQCYAKIWQKLTPIRGYLLVFLW